MKSIWEKILSIVLIVCCSAAVPVDIAFGATSVAKAKKSYQSALKAEQEAKKAFDVAGKEYKKGSLGFFQWVADNNTGWKKEDANEAIQVLTKTAFKKYTKIGSTNDATELTNMKTAINLLPVLQKKRAGDNNFPGLPDPTVRNVFMARSQVNANASSYTMKHMPVDTGCPTDESNECLAWGYADPFDGWYDDEKESYDEMRAYFLKKYKVDINDDKALDDLTDKISMDKYLEECSQFGEIGHYCNVCCGKTADYTDDGVVFGMANLAIFGIGFSKYGSWGSCHCLNGDVTDNYEEAYSVAEYTNMFNTYFNQVYPKAEITAYNSARKKAKSALSSLKKSMSVKKPKAKRAGKKVTVKWKKVSGVDGYQISVATSKGKTKIVATAKKKAAKKVIRLKKAKKQYVKIRAYVNVNGKKVTGKWSKVATAK